MSEKRAHAERSVCHGCRGTHGAGAAGAQKTCLGWPQEAAMRMPMNNLDPEVAERPDDLVVYGGTGRAARSWAAYDAIVRTLQTLKNDETLLIQSGKPVGVLRTHELARGCCFPTRCRCQPGQPGRSSASWRSRPHHDGEMTAGGFTSARRGFCRAPTRRWPRSLRSISVEPCAGG